MKAREMLQPFIRAMADLSAVADDLDVIDECPCDGDGCAHPSHLVDRVATIGGYVEDLTARLALAGEVEAALAGGGQPGGLS